MRSRSYGMLLVADLSVALDFLRVGALRGFRVEDRGSAKGGEVVRACLDSFVVHANKIGVCGGRECCHEGWEDGDNDRGEKACEVHRERCVNVFCGVHVIKLDRN